MQQNSPVLVVLAAGMGSRFGGLKQITPVDEQGHMIIDFSLYDAKRAGFKTVVFIIKHAIEKEFREAIGSRIEPHLNVRYVFQELDKLPDGFSIPEGRVKPFGTGHAIACAAEQIDGPFAVINADDFYGPGAFAIAYDFLKEKRGEGEHALVSYLLRNTVSEHGSVSRGICEVENGFLSTVTERSHIEKRGNDAAYTEDGTNFTPISGDTPVSMNLWGFQRELLPHFQSQFEDFLREQLPQNPLKGEFYLSAVANTQIKDGTGSVAVLPTDEAWHGITYREDLQGVKDAIASMKAAGTYPEKLWG